MLSPLFSRPVPPSQREYFLPALGEPLVKRERITKHVKSWNETGLVPYRGPDFSPYPIIFGGNSSNIREKPPSNITWKHAAEEDSSNGKNCQISVKESSSTLVFAFGDFPFPYSRTLMNYWIHSIIWSINHGWKRSKDMCFILLAIITVPDFFTNHLLQLTEHQHNNLWHLPMHIR